MASTTKPVLTGGCQCGAIRFALSAAPTRVSICHCRMCQKASGAPFASFADIDRADFAWPRGTPAAFRSSSIAERDFCANCGTPLSYAFEGTGRISVAINSLDDPEAMPPAKQYGTESKVSWIEGIHALPGQTSEEWLKDKAAQMVNNQRSG